jgi:hypothetical protein
LYSRQYHGGKRLKDAAQLADFDVVVTTYSILGTEFGAALKASTRQAHASRWDCEAHAQGSTSNVCGHNNAASSEKCTKCGRGYKNETSIAARLRATTVRPVCEQVFWHRVVLDERFEAKGFSSLLFSENYPLHVSLPRGTFPVF